MAKLLSFHGLSRLDAAHGVCQAIEHTLNGMRVLRQPQPAVVAREAGTMEHLRLETNWVGAFSGCRQASRNAPVRKRRE